MLMAVAPLPMRLDALAQRDTLRVGVLMSATDVETGATESLARGVDLGAQEATRTAALFGVFVEVTPERMEAGQLVSFAERLLGRGVQAIVVGAGMDCNTLSRLATNRVVLLFTAACEVDVPLHDRCARIAFHLVPSAATRQRAQSSHAHQRESSVGDSVRLAVWHHSLHRFGAEQLNERFERRFGAEMDSSAWAGWIAMKILVESALRSRSTRSADLARYLLRSETRFDGHKGEPLAFDVRTGELHQPLYVLAMRAPGEHLARVAAELRIASAFAPADGDTATAPPCADVRAP
jgi:hypothetical protein